MMYVYKKKIYKTLFFILDIIGYILFFPFKLWQRKRIQSFKRLLLIRIDHIGDVINAISVTEPLRKVFPNICIDFIVPSWATEILDNNLHITHVIGFDSPWFSRNKFSLINQIKGFFKMFQLIKNGRYDVAIDLRGDVRHIAAMFFANVRYRISYGITGGSFLLTHNVSYNKIIHEIEKNTALLKPLGLDNPSMGDVKLYLESSDKVDLFKIKLKLKDPYAVVHPVPGHIQKEWNLDGFSSVVRYISHKGIIPVLVGSVLDKIFISEVISKTKVDAIDVSGKTDLKILAGLLKAASFFIGVDSGPSHIAAALGIPTIILFSGVNDPAIWAPRGDNINVIYPGRGKDLSLITSEEVFKVIEHVVQQCELKTKF